MRTFKLVVIHHIKKVMELIEELHVDLRKLGPAEFNKVTFDSKASVFKSLQ